MFTEARAEISGPSEKHLKPGSVLRLTCRVVENIENPLYIFWYQNNHMINYDSHRGVNVSTESGMCAIQTAVQKCKLLKILIQHDRQQIFGAHDIADNHQSLWKL